VRIHPSGLLGAHLDFRRRGSRAEGMADLPCRQDPDVATARRTRRACWTWWADRDMADSYCAQDREGVNDNRLRRGDYCLAIIRGRSLCIHNPRRGSFPVHSSTCDVEIVCRCGCPRVGAARVASGARMVVVSRRATAPAGKAFAARTKRGRDERSSMARCTMRAGGLTCGLFRASGDVWQSLDA